MSNDLAHIGIIFIVVMSVVCYQAFAPWSWWSKHVPSVFWHEKKWHYEKHLHCDGLGVEWFHNGQWQAIPKDLRTNYPSLGNTRKCRCVMGKVVVIDNPDGDELSDYYALPPKNRKDEFPDDEG